jgi:hypothetical protein
MGLISTSTSGLAGRGEFCRTRIAARRSAASVQHSATGRIRSASTPKSSVVVS